MFPPHPFDMVNVAVELCDIPRLCFRHYMPAAPCISVFVVKLIGRALYGLFVESMRILLTMVYAGLLSVSCQIDFLWQDTHNIRQVFQRRRHWSLQQLRMNMIVQIQCSQFKNIRTMILVGCSIYAHAIPVGILVQLLIMCIFEVWYFGFCAVTTICIPCMKGLSMQEVVPTLICGRQRCSTTLIASFIMMTTAIPLMLWCVPWQHAQVLFMQLIIGCVEVSLLLCMPEP